MNYASLAKTLICRRLGLLKSGCQPSDKVIVQWIHKETGWPLPNKAGKRLYMMRYLESINEIQGGEAKLLREYIELERMKQAVKPVPPPAAPKKPKKDFFMCAPWRAIRYEVLKKFGLTCQCCGATPKSGRQIHVDHIKPRSLYPELALDITNLQVLCEDCNLGKSNTDQTDWRPSEAEVLPEFAVEHLRSLN